MLVILLPEQVPKYWAEIRYYIVNALPVHKHSGHDIRSILMHILGGVLLVAFLTDKDGIIIGVFTLAIVRDEVTGVNNLEIMTGYSLRLLNNIEVDDMMKTLKPFAQSKDCSNIIFYSDIEEAIRGFEQGGGKRHNFVMWEV